MDSEQPYSLSDPDPPLTPSPRDAGSLLVSRPEKCPNCGQVLPADDSVVCIHCGYDLRTVVIRTTKIEEPIEAPPEALPLTRERIPTQVTGITAAVAATIVVIAYFAGYSGLFARQEGLFLNAEGKFAAASPPAGIRMHAVISFLAIRSILVLAGLGALRIHSHLKAVPVGSLPKAAVHLAAISAVGGLFLLISFSHPGLESAAELVAQGSVAVLGLLLLFRLAVMDALLMIVVTVLLLILVIGSAFLVTWIV